MNINELQQLQNGDRVISTAQGPVLVRDGRYWSVNAIRKYGTHSLVGYEVRYELKREDDFARFGITKEKGQL